MMRSIRYTLRLWRRNPGATFVAVLAMAFGIGLVSTQFSFMNGVLLRGLPFEDAGRLVYLERLNPQTLLSASLPLAEFKLFLDRQQSFEELGAFATGLKTVSSQDRLPQRYRGAEVTANVHRLLRLQPVMGRGLQPGDADAGAPRVALLGHRIESQLRRRGQLG